MKHTLTFLFRPVKFSSWILLLGWLIASQFVRAEDWPRFRGPDGTGISRESHWHFSSQSPVLWEARIGLGYSMPVVAGGKVVVSGHTGAESDSLFCFDEATGKENWKFTYAQPLGDHYFPGGTTGSASMAGDRVYSLAREGELFCLDTNSGKVIWQVHLQKDFQYTKPTWGFTGAPLVQDDRLYITAGDSGLALNKSNGQVIWKSKNEEAGYSTPYSFSRGGKELLIFSNKRAYVCVEAASGKELWREKWMTRYGVNAADPIVSGDYIFISSGYGKGATLLKWDGNGDPKTVWKNRDMKTQMNACVLLNGFLYGIDGGEHGDAQGLKCMEFLTGKTMWLDQTVGFGAVSAANGKLLVISETGELQMGPASPSGWKPEVKRRVLGPKAWTVPVLADGKIFCRNSIGHLVVFNVKSQ